MAEYQIHVQFASEAKEETYYFQDQEDMLEALTRLNEGASNQTVAVINPNAPGKINNGPTYLNMGNAFRWYATKREDGSDGWERLSAGSPNSTTEGWN